VVKRKDSIALFEVISKGKKRSQTDMTVPGWMEASGTQASGETVAPSPAAESAQAPAAAPVAAPVRPLSMRTAVEPVMAKAGGRLRVSLSYAGCMAAALVLVALLVGAFWLGRTTAPAPAGPGMKAPYRPQLVETGKPAEPGSAANTTATMNLPKRIAGKYYLVIESTGGSGDWHLEQARKIQKFCYENGEPSEVRQLGGKYVVWSLTPFDSSSSEQARQHAQAIEKLGGTYFRTYGSFRFQQRKKPDSPLEPLYLKEKD